MELLNQQALEQLERDTSPEIVPVILGRFLGELETRCAAIRAALESGDAEQIGLEAHSVKSAARTFGLEQLSEQARLLEALADAGAGADLGNHAGAMLDAADAARNALQTFLAGS